MIYDWGCMTDDFMTRSDVDEIDEVHTFRVWV
jgi:hypothetical protein